MLKDQKFYQGEKEMEKRRKNKSPNPCTCKAFLFFFHTSKVPIQNHMSKNEVVCFSHPSEQAKGWKWGWVPYSQTCPEVANFDLATSQINCSRIIGSWFKSIEMLFSCMWGGLLISSLGQSLKLFCDSGLENEENPCNGMAHVCLLWVCV